MKILGKDALAVLQADVVKLGEIDKLFAAVSEKVGKIDVLFVNPGVAKFVPLNAVTEERYDEIFDIDAKGAYFTIQKALPYLNDGASIILNTSVAGQKGPRSQRHGLFGHESGTSFVRPLSSSGTGLTRHSRERRRSPAQSKRRSSAAPGFPRKRLAILRALSVRRWVLRIGPGATAFTRMLRPTSSASY